MNLLTKFVKHTKRFNNWIKESNRWFAINLTKPNNDFQKVTPNQIKLGSFYFLKYDLAGINKSTKIEQLAIIYVVDYKPLIDSKVFWAINFNFLPSEIRRNFFLSYLDNRYDSILEYNDKQRDWFDEKPIPNVNYKNIVKDLSRINVVYSKCIRTFRIDLINEIYGISTKNLEKLISLDVRPISGMDDAGILKVLAGKIKNEGIEAVAQEIIQDYDTILKDLKERYKNIEKELSGE